MTIFELSKLAHLPTYLCRYPIRGSVSRAQGESDDHEAGRLVIDLPGQRIGSSSQLPLPITDVGKYVTGEAGNREIG